MTASDRGRLRNVLADRIEQHAELAALESLSNGKPVRYALAADPPLTIKARRSRSPTG